MLHSMKRILIIDTGGTISQVKGSDGSLIPGKADIISIVPRLSALADIEYKLITRVDSTDMTGDIRIQIVEEIQKYHREFDGFVITHGTDTMADTACALNYLIQDLGKPIVLTGAQLPIFAPGPDGLNNLYYSVMAAASDIGEVVICFGDRIIRGNRAVKENVHGFNAFSSPRTAPIGNLGIHLKLNENRIKRYKGSPRFYTELETRVALYSQVSGSTSDYLGSFAENPLVQGVILTGFGTGNVQKKLLEPIKKITDAGKPVIITTTCTMGSTILEQYHTGLTAMQAGALPAYDLTPTAAAQKLMYVLGRCQQPEEVRRYFHEPVGRDLESPSIMSGETLST